MLDNRPMRGIKAGRGWIVAAGGLLAAVLFASVATGQTSPEAPPPPVPGGPPVQPHFTIKAEKGFIDDPFAIAPEAKALAVLLTDAASFARVDIIDLETGKPRRTIELGDPQRLFERVLLADGDQGVVVVSRDAGTGRRSAQYYNAQGKAAGLVGPVTDFGVATREGQRWLISWSKSPSGTNESFTVIRHRLAGLGRVGKPELYTVSKAGELHTPPLKAIEWQDGYAQIVGLRPGEYDPKKDVRLPGHAAILDTLSATIKWEAEVGDVVAWAAASELRRKMPGRSLFAVFSPDTKIFDLIDFQGRRGPIEPPVPLRYYDPTTLQEQESFTTGSLLFSLAIDPLHPEALARRKKDPSYLDIYWAHPQAVKAQAPTGREPLHVAIDRLLRAPMDDRPATWLAEGGYAAVLRKHKSFSRGGNALEVYGLERTAPP